jgi:hypothetical protein
MAEYIVWVKQAEHCWERYDVDMLELAKLIRDQQQARQRDALITRKVSDGDTASAAAGPEVVPVSVAQPAAEGDTVSAVSAPAADGEPKLDLEIRVLTQLKEALTNLDPPAVRRVANWAMEYARATRDQVKT